MIRSLLVIDDDRDERESLAGLFRREGYVVFSADGAKTARRLLDTIKPRAIVAELDISGSGVQLIASLRRDPRYRSVRIVALTGDPLAPLPQGANHLVRKPVPARSLLEVIALASA